LEEGPPHEKCFHIEVKLGRKSFGKGMGTKSKLNRRLPSKGLREWRN